VELARKLKRDVDKINSPYSNILDLVDQVYPAELIRTIQDFAKITVWLAV
jgi:hypothetical protein